jgi:CyaY protein
MTESEFLDIAEISLNKVEILLEHASERIGLDIECVRSDNLLEIDFIGNSSKIIISIQLSMQELWIAAKSGGFHYKRKEDRWINTRDNSEFFTALSTMVSTQGGVEVLL